MKIIETALAQITFENPLRYDNIVDIANSIATYLAYLGAPIVLLMVLIGAFYLMTSGGSQERVSKGKKYILYAAVGFAIILLARGIVAIIMTALGVEQ